MNFTINIQAPELAKSIELLAAALNGKPVNLVGGVDLANGPDITVVNGQPVQQPANVVPFQQQAPTTVPVQPAPNEVPTAQYQAPPVQHQQPMQQQAPVQQQPQAVPTTAPGYTMDQLAVAATQLMDAGRQQDLLSLLATFGVQSLMQLPLEQYGVFATKLREMGAKI